MHLCLSTFRKSNNTYKNSNVHVKTATNTRWQSGQIQQLQQLHLASILRVGSEFAGGVDQRYLVTRAWHPAATVGRLWGAGFIWHAQIQAFTRLRCAVQDRQPQAIATCSGCVCVANATNIHRVSSWKMHFTNIYRWSSPSNMHTTKPQYTASHIYSCVWTW